MNINIPVTFRFLNALEIKFTQVADPSIAAAISQLQQQLTTLGATMQSKIQEVLEASRAALAQSTATRGAVNAIPPAVNALEATITDLKGKLAGSLTDEDNAALDEALANVKGATQTAVDTASAASTAAADASDGIDEAAQAAQQGSPPAPNA